MEDYESVWESFLRERRLEFGGHMDPAWQEGHGLSASLVVPGEASRFHECLEPLREVLRPFPFASLHPDHFMHITLILLGFLVDEPENDCEISRERLQEIEDLATDVNDPKRSRTRNQGDIEDAKYGTDLNRLQD